MRAGLQLGQETGFQRPAGDSMQTGTIAQAAKEIPYDYVAKFKLQGKAGNRVQDVINISTEGSFVAVAIGYSFIPSKLPKLEPIKVELPSAEGVLAIPGSTTTTTLAEVFAEAVADKFKLDVTNRKVDKILTIRHLAAVIQPLTEPQFSRSLFLKLCGINFKYSIVDSGTGRELQNQPIHNIAGLGEASGDRPFRPFAKPMTFMPRSTIRIEVEEISVGSIYEEAELYIVLHGYKILGHGI
jgi:hypothetical protein